MYISAMYSYEHTYNENMTNTCYVVEDTQQLQLPVRPVVLFHQVIGLIVNIRYY